MKFYKYLKLKWCFLLIAFSLGNVPIVKASELNWKPASQNNPLQLQSQPSNQESFAKQEFTREELRQTIRGLKLINIFGISDSKTQIETLNTNLKQLLQNQSSPYQLSPSQFRSLRSIFSSLTNAELTAINKILLIQNKHQSIKLTQQEILTLRQTLSNIPADNLNELQNKQLAVILDFLKKIPKQQSVLLSSQQTEALSNAIAFVFFTPTTQAQQRAQLPEIEKTRQISLNQNELDRIIKTLQAIQTIHLRPKKDAKITRLLTQLEKRQKNNNIVSLSPKKTQQLQTLIASLSPNETAAIEIFLLSDRAPNNLTLTQQQIDDLITFSARLYSARIG